MCHPHGVLVEANLRTKISRIEVAVETRLSEKIDGGPKLDVEEKRETGIEEVVGTGVDQTRGWLIKVVKLQVKRAA